MSTRHESPASPRIPKTPKTRSSKSAKQGGEVREADQTALSANGSPPLANVCNDCDGGDPRIAQPQVRPWPKPSVRYGDARTNSREKKPFPRNSQASRNRHSVTQTIAAVRGESDTRGRPSGGDDLADPAPNTPRTVGAVTLRARPSRWLKRRVVETQNSKCLGCGSPIGPECVDMDHVVPLALGGLNHIDNWAALCRACHKGKTAKDLRQIAKAKRQLRFQATGRGKAIKGVSLSDPDFVRHVDGVATPRSKDGQSNRWRMAEPQHNSEVDHPPAASNLDGAFTQVSQV
jgi:5-methylcytosine-specific restriction endonuclease McrA